jgi:hypothetical protein
MNLNLNFFIILLPIIAMGLAIYLLYYVNKDFFDNNRGGCSE